MIIQANGLDIQILQSLNFAVLFLTFAVTACFTLQRIMRSKQLHRAFRYDMKLTDKDLAYDLRSEVMERVWFPFWDYLQKG